MFVAETHVSRKEKESRCSTKAMTMLHEEVILTNTVAARATGSHQLHFFFYCYTHTHTHTNRDTHTQTITSPLMLSIVLPPSTPTQLSPRLPVTQM